MVTGAAGFIGSHLVENLVARGVTTVAVDRRARGSDALADENLAPARGDPRCVLVSADLAQDGLDDAVDGCDVVFHLAARPGVRQSWGDEFDDYIRSNVVGTRRLLDACVRRGVRRVVFASSSSVYGPIARPSRESDPTCPMSPYGVSKLAAEQLCLAYARRPDSALSVVALRYFTVFGPRQRPDMAIARLLFAAYTGFPIEIFGDGSQRRDFTYVTDIVDATIAAADIDVLAAVVNVGGGTSASMNEVIALVGQCTSRRVPTTSVAARPGDVPVTAADLSQAQQLLGYQPAVGLAEGIARQTSWLVGLPHHRLLAFTP
ncbi:NAD-dependent epimerase/dehydratase family protein [Frankia sp. CN6]|uniref:NAD-dependent epimerase/dehydratase family protein n=2 Tax=Frankia nepalensis TaxID=1836974 RepID=A0A937RPU0_9ACTN|nr:NAD-dependent epimerase/dehydratase family protein [Frankia nepalensis]MBL7631179.1 NAD-dependent epimerase/dehydratase family protein [Frankia nepalensis]